MTTLFTYANTNGTLIYLMVDIMQCVPYTPKTPLTRYECTAKSCTHQTERSLTIKIAAHLTIAKLIFTITLIRNIKIFTIL